MRDIKKLVSEMTLEEKAGMCSGKDFWHLKEVARLGIPSVIVCDGPHGLRRQDKEADHLGINDSIEAVCFPSAAGTAASFDRELMYYLGETLGEECQAEDVSVLLGPGINIKRSPLCGRNFEYISEDPFLAGELGAAYINGVQSKNVGTSVKHYAANNQETRRMTSSSNIDERTLREIYLAPFETTVKKAQPWTIMNSYNRINGEYVSESARLLTEILRNEWKYEGYVVTDWGATNDRVLGLQAGQDLEMPSSDGINDKRIVEAIQAGTLSETILDKSVEKILDTIFRYVDNRDENATFDKAKDHQIARKIACESMVLLKNETILPLSTTQKIAFIGEFAEKPRFQGSGSSHINTKSVVSALEAVKGTKEVTYAKGYRLEDEVIDDQLVLEAIEAAKANEVVVLFVGLPDVFESEGFDRTHLRLPENQRDLIEKISQVQPNCVVVLHNGAPVEMPWLDTVKGVLESYLGGEAVGEAQVDLLFGLANPSGKLAETFPLRLEDTPSYLNFPGDGDVVNYNEGVFVGYRYYDTKKMPVLFPFGFGLSYTDFEYSQVKVSPHTASGETDVEVKVTVKNIGDCFGKEAVQVYVTEESPRVRRPAKELKQFAKVSLEPGEEKEVTMILDRRAFSYYDVSLGDWVVNPGKYFVHIGKSSQEIVASEPVFREEPPRKGWRVSRNTTFGDLMADPVSKEAVEGMMANFVGSELMQESGDAGLGGAGAEMMEAMMVSIPLRALLSFSQGQLTESMLDQFVAGINQGLEQRDASF